ncbi:MAG: aspartate-semialdehyde dehydrogenase [Bacteroidales bacterium]|nr:aspartate-semialdehyde dehydrogenase [Bacteroidales bacterium]
MKLAIVGASGLVGRTLLSMLEKNTWSVDEYFLVTSDKSAGKKVEFRGKAYNYITIREAIENKPDIAIFSAGSQVSLTFAPKFAEVGCRVVDNSSAWRMDPDKKLIVPEINGNTLTQNDFIIANPNCSTIQMLLPLAPLHREYRIKRIVVSTYQSISGSGQKAMAQFENERQSIVGEQFYPHPIDKNCLPHCDVFLDNDYTKEEMKLVHETHKILGDDGIAISATAVRVPVTGGHSESLNVEFEKSIDINGVRQILSTTQGVILQDDPKNNVYPMPLMASGKDDVFVGRIRKDLFQSNTINMWVVADNLRKGAATNAIQIADLFIKKGWLK